jgi:hypothetical protein
VGEDIRWAEKNKPQFFGKKSAGTAAGSGLVDFEGAIVGPSPGAG